MASILELNNRHNAGNIAIDKTISNLNADDVQGAIDEVKGTVGYSKKNLIVYPYDGNKTANGTTWTVNTDGTVVANGKSSSGDNFECSNRVRGYTKLKAGTYILNGCPSNGSDSTYYIQVGKTANDGSSYELIGLDVGEGLTFTLTEETMMAISCVIGQGHTSNNIVFKPMIRYASIEDDTYEPYVEDVQTQINTLKSPENIYTTGKLTSSTSFANFYRYTATKKCIVSLTPFIYFDSHAPKGVGISCGSKSISCLLDTGNANRHVMSTSATYKLEVGESLECQAMYHSEGASQTYAVSGCVQYLE